MALVTIRIERTVRTVERSRVRPRRRVLVAALALVGGVLTASSIHGSAAQATVVPLTPAKVLYTNTYLGANKTVIPVVSGASTTVPTNASRVQFSVTVSKQQQPGSVYAHPTGNPAGASGEQVAWAGPNQTVTGTLTVLVGSANKVTFVNQSAGVIYLSVKITGYHVDEGAAYAFQNVVSYPLSSNNFAPVAALSVPPGTYHVTFGGTITNFGTQASAVGVCSIQEVPTASLHGGPQTNMSTVRAAAVNTSIPVFLTSIVQTNGYIAVSCYATSGGFTIGYPSMVVTEVDEPHVS